MELRYGMDGQLPNAAIKHLHNKSPYLKKACVLTLGATGNNSSQWKL